MRKVVFIVTSDNVAHATHADALRHADKRYGGLLSKLAHDACRSTDGKYIAMLTWLDTNRAELATLPALHADMTMQEGDDE